MSELRKANTDLAYFLTITVVGWIDIFTRSRYNDISIDSLKYCQINKALDIFAYVIMPSHLHLVARNLEGNLNLVIRDFKRHTANEIISAAENETGESRKDWLLHMFRYHARFKRQNTKYQFWQKTNYPIELKSSSVIDQKIEYIHNNPVEAGLVLRPECWQYSSANEMNKIDVLLP